ncbi:TatD family hydrolase [Candidatus Nomurabacteria bacterium]|nr:TatD family hydrolase [Candidatus Nomurabacteria bacterium]USN94591.1 MAG: TatD family hydrolase [Candidatus Nomurabacteria bacterium]
MNFKYIDIHSHLNLSPLLEEEKSVVSDMREKSVVTITIGTGLVSSKLALDISERHSDVCIGASIGMHPTDTKEPFDYEKFLELAQNPKTLAIGECGLDYFRNQDEEMKKIQKEIFKKHIDIAKTVNKPLMIHARPSKGSMDAYEDVLDILEETNLSLDNKIRANFHFFVGNKDIAERAQKSGFTMSFDGPITFSGDYDEVIEFLPIESIMTETDAPYAAPAPYRGKTCMPWMVEEVYKSIARIKGLDEEFVRNTLNENAKRFFDIKA